MALSLARTKEGAAHMYHFLVNPSSCSGRGGRYWELVKKTLEEKGISYQVRFSKKAGDMERFAAELTQADTVQGGSDAGGEPVHLIVLGGARDYTKLLQTDRMWRYCSDKQLYTQACRDSGHVR